MIRWCHKLQGQRCLPETATRNEYQDLGRRAAEAIPRPLFALKLLLPEASPPFARKSLTTPSKRRTSRRRHQETPIEMASTSRPFCPSTALLRRLSRALQASHNGSRPSASPSASSSSSPLLPSSRRTIHASSRRFDAQEPKSFRSQLYESTARRIQRQRDEEAQYAASRPISTAARNFSLTFCSSSLHCLTVMVKPERLTSLRQRWLRPLDLPTSLGPRNRLMSRLRPRRRCRKCKHPSTTSKSATYRRAGRTW